jgi:hypothetical protein
MLNSIMNMFQYYLKIIKKIPFLNKIYIFFSIFLNFSFEKILEVKIQVNKFYEKYLINNNFILLQTKLIYNNHNGHLIKLNINNFMNEKKINILQNKLFDEIIKYYYINDIKYNNDIRLQLNYKFNNKNYKIFYSYLEINNGKENYNKLNKNEMIIPFYDKEYIELFNIVKAMKEKIDYFKMNCKDIEYIKINDKIYNNSFIEEYLGPLLDFGFIYRTPIKIKWILDELVIDELYSFELKFMTPYFDEDEMDLIDHLIKTNDKNEILISNITNKLFNNY